MPDRNSWDFSVVAAGWLLVLAILAVAPVQAGTTTDIRIVPGAPGALITGAVIRGERDVYRLNAFAGQTLRVEIVSVEENAVFQIYLPGKGNRTLPSAGPMDDAKVWHGKLPTAGLYRIVVGGTRGNAEYTLRVDVDTE